MNTRVRSGFMGAHLDLNDVVADHPLAKQELDDLRCQIEDLEWENKGIEEWREVAATAIAKAKELHAYELAARLRPTIEAWNETKAERDALRNSLQIERANVAATDEALVEVTRERDALRALLAEARESWIKVGYGASHEDVVECHDFCKRIDAALRE